MSIQKAQGKDCTAKFKAAYENRYTWERNFIGYKGSCSWSNGEKTEQGSFVLGQDLKTSVSNVNDDDINKAISSQLWEVAIHRIRRSFEQTHGQNTFTMGDVNKIGLEVLVGGKNKGDKYRIKDDIVTMVYRHIHGKLIVIETQEVIHTGSGYLSKRYSSQYIDPKSKEPIKPKSFYEDNFEPLFDGGPWVLQRRCITNEYPSTSSHNKQIFSFANLETLNES